MEKVKWYLYILYCVSADNYYTGITQDLEDRLSRHNQGRNTSTKNGAPWILKYLETYSSRGEAQQREYQIKGRKSRKYIEDLISAGQSVPLRKPS